MKPEKALLHTASAVLHILRQCRKMLHTPTGVLHKNESFSDLARRSKAKTAEALFQSSFHSAMKHFPFHSKNEAFA